MMVAPSRFPSMPVWMFWAGVAVAALTAILGLMRITLKANSHVANKHPDSTFLKVDGDFEGDVEDNVSDARQFADLRGDVSNSSFRRNRHERRKADKVRKD
ncbi:hypothetical protein [Sphingosinicella rhizophila]|uniref:Uncharacterized protein n=1 Tax=Sphingosinicella rhizophila TaxID=3050082 RepID=A0ABU3Q540_9SPHN|nr:hypothetical protein [Sphingosinicella sp. GR2756]MDT9598533.1 hypothetical protein [Sphingosinicella sp. GR2756]